MFRPQSTKMDYSVSAVADDCLSNQFGCDIETYIHVVSVQQQLDKSSSWRSVVVGWVSVIY